VDEQAELVTHVCADIAQAACLQSLEVVIGKDVLMMEARVSPAAGIPLELRSGRLIVEESNGQFARSRTLETSL